MAQEKRIRDVTFSGKRFPVCREMIDKGGWTPDILCDQSGAYWDGFTATDAEGKAINGLSDSCRKEMICLILDGAFGETAKDLYLDQTHYWKIRDELITWPNQEAILSRGLQVMKLKREMQPTEPGQL